MNASTYTEEQAAAALGIDAPALARLSARIRAPLWFRVGDQTVFSRDAVDRLATEANFPERHVPDAMTLALSEALAASNIVACGIGSPRAVAVQKATYALVEAYRLLDLGFTASKVTEAQATAVAGKITSLAADIVSAAGYG